MVLDVQNLHKSFGEKQVLKGVSFRAESGRALGLLGRNGAGKTTTIRIIMGVFPPNSGEITADGSPIDRNKLRIGYLPEEHGLYPKVEIVEQLVYLAELRGMKRADAKANAQRWLKRLEMDGYAGKKLDTLSKGNQQKIQLVAALVNEPELIILDEPFSGLDPVNAALLKDVVNELIQGGRMVVFSSHQMSYVEEFCDSIAILHDGHIVLDGRIEEIKRGYDRGTLSVRSTQSAEAARFIAAQSGLVEAVEPKGAVLQVRLRAEENKAALLAALAASGLDIDAVAVHEPTLNDIFVEYTGDSKEASV